MSQLRLLQAVLWVAFAALAWHFLDTFPNGWDQTEYAWAVQSGYLPHSPYILYFLAGKLLGVALSAPLALSALSFASGLAAVWLLTGTAAALLGAPGAPTVADRRAATLGVLLAAGTFILVRQAGTQEVYPLQCCLLVGAARSVAGGARRWRLLLCGVLCGAAIAAHSGSVFALPALAFLAVSRAAIPRGRAALVWLGGVVATLGVAVALIAALLPAGVELAGYLRGIAPRVAFESLTDPKFLAESIASIFRRLTDHGIPIVRVPPESGPLGLSVLHLGAGVSGAALALLRSRSAGVFAVLWAAPYLAYEIAVGWNVDWGVYAVFVLPALAWSSAFLFRRLLDTRTLSTWRGRAAALLLAGIVATALIPNVLLLAGHWGDTESDREEHFTDGVIAALWIRDHASAGALVLQPSSEWNVNVLPFYSQRQHAMLRGPSYGVFDAFGTRFSPLNLGSYSPLTTARLGAWIREGREVYALEREPLARMDRRLIDSAPFEWPRARVISLQEVAASHALPHSVRERVAGRQVTLYRARLR
jgi:hypothetical protein